MRYVGLVALAVGFTLSGCTDQPTEPSFAVGALGDGVAPSASIVGETGPGSTYEILVPPAWNGDLVLYAHGYVDPQETDPLTDFERALLPVLPTMGYAVAYSSFSESGLDIKDGAQRTKQLEGLFTSKVGQPNRTFLAGGSMGGLIALSLAERYPGHYDGLLAMCGMVGGSQAQIDYVANVRILFDALFPDVLPGGPFDNPGLSPAEIVGLVGPAIAANPGAAATLSAVMASTFGTPIPGSSPQELAQSIIAALTFDVRGFADVLDRTHDHYPFDNTDVQYSGSLDDATLNAAVARFEAGPDATHYLEKYYEPTGLLEIPMVTLHNAMDPVVPAFHETRLAAAAAATGHEGSLTQLTAAQPYGHCAFGADEVLGAFAGLVSAAGG